MLISFVIIDGCLALLFKRFTKHYKVKSVDPEKRIGGVTPPSPYESIAMHVTTFVLRYFLTKLQNCHFFRLILDPLLGVQDTIWENC